MIESFFFRKRGKWKQTQKRDVLVANPRFQCVIDSPLNSVPYRSVNAGCGCAAVSAVSAPAADPDPDAVADADADSADADSADAPESGPCDADEDAVLASPFCGARVIRF